MDAATVKTGVLAVLAAIGGALTAALGGWDVLLKVLIGMMAADYLTGLLIAAIWKKSNKSETGTLDSKASFKGLVKKCMILLLVYVAVLLDAAIGTTYIRSAVIIFYIGNEGLSLLENLCIMGVPHPKFLEKILQVLLERGDKGDDPK
ncbi:MAG: phage holin family protein [Ruminococcaceae bacterium]|nr:phage holin family protein [Oscillospiraceae bacterium]